MSNNLQTLQTKYQGITQTIYCTRSGVPLLSATTLCNNGWPLLSTGVIASLTHPVYNFPLTKLLQTLDKQLDQAESFDYAVASDSVLPTEMGLTMSAIMYSLDCIHQPPYGVTPSLPSWQVIVGSARRLFNLASWFHHATSKRLSFPLYAISKLNNNLQWNNYSSWLDDAYAIKQDWALGRANHDVNELLQSKLDMQTEVSMSSVYTKIDFNKVWNWIATQVTSDSRYSEGRLTTWKSMFLSGLKEPEQWTEDDVDDLILATTECCDMSNDISAFINKRLNNLRGAIRDFYSGFTLLSDSKQCVVRGDTTQQEVDTTNKFLSAFDEQVAELTELPPQPTRSQFLSLGLYLKANAEWSILSKRFVLLKAPATPVTTVVSVATATNTAGEL